MAVASLSSEAQIANRLRELGCAESNFAVISGVMGKTRLAQGLAGDKDFDRDDAERMLNVLEEMRELRDMLQTPPDWKQTDQIRTALEQRRQVKKLVQEVNEFLKLNN